MLVIVFLFVFFVSSVSDVSASSGLLYSTYFGGGSNDSISDVATDHLGNVYITGTTSSSSDFPTKNALQQVYGGGQQDAFVAKFSPQGNLIYSTFLGGSNSDQGTGITVDNEGSVYIVGYTYSTNFPTRNPYQGSSAGGRDVFIVKLSNDGSSVIYSTYLGGGSDDLANGIAVNDYGDVYITGNTTSSNYPIINAYQDTFSRDASGNFSGDAFITKLSSDGSTILFSTYLGGISSDSGNDITVDTLGNAYVVGTTSSTNFPTLNAYDNNLDDGVDTTKSDAFVTKLTSNGLLAFSTYLGGFGWNSGEIGNAITVDSSNNIYVTGKTSSVNFPVVNAYQGTLRGSSDIFITKFSNNGSSLAYSTYLGGNCNASTGSGNEEGRSIAVNSTGNVYMSGYSVCSDFPMTNPIQNIRLGSYDAVVTELSNDWSGLLFSTYLGGGVQGGITGVEIGERIIIDNSGNIYVVGKTTSSNFPTHNAYQSIFGGYDGGSDGFVIKIGDNQPPTANAGFDQTGNEGQQITLDGSGSTDPDGISDIVSYNWNFGDGFTGNGQTVNHTYQDNGVYTATLTVTDSQNESDTDTAIITVNNVVPIVNAGAGVTINEGGQFIRTGSFTDPGTLDTHTATVNYGDGTGTLPLTLSGNNFNLNHLYQDDGIYTVTVRVTDSDAGFGIGTLAVTVNNLAPVVNSISSVSPVLPEVQINVSSSFTDLGILDTHTAVWNWGDGTTTQGAVTESGGSGSVTGSHTYMVAGIYTITLTVTDDDGGIGQSTFQITIQTPAQATQSLIDTVETFNLQQGIENSLDVKLDAALDALNDLNENNEATINSLQAFISAVEAQRGNKITNEQADILIQKAETIIINL